MQARREVQVKKKWAIPSLTTNSVRADSRLSTFSLALGTETVLLGKRVYIPYVLTSVLLALNRMATPSLGRPTELNSYWLNGIPTFTNGLKALLLSWLTNLWRTSGTIAHDRSWFASLLLDLFPDTQGRALKREA